jgi:hypothetical protein
MWLNSRPSLLAASRALRICFQSCCDPHRPFTITTRCDDLPSQQLWIPVEILVAGFDCITDRCAIDLLIEIAQHTTIQERRCLEKAYDNASLWWHQIHGMIIEVECGWVRSDINIPLLMYKFNGNITVTVF